MFNLKRDHCKLAEVKTKSRAHLAGGSPTHLAKALKEVQEEIKIMQNF